MDKDIIRSKDGRIELCMSDVKKSGRVKITMSALKICQRGEWNKNGITWLEEYCENNKESAIGMDYVVSFLDGTDGCPTDHGDITYDEDGNVVFENSVSVGHVEEVEIKDVLVDGVMQRLFITRGYICQSRYPKFVKWLKEEIQNDRVCGSIEITGKAGADEIIYEDGKSKNEDGTPYIGRIPVEFDFSGLAILCKEIAEPADDNSIVFEVNSKNNQKGEIEESMSKVISKSKTVEINNITIYELYNKVIDAVNQMLNKNYQYDTWVYEVYIDTCEVIIKDESFKDTFYATTYSFVDGKLIIGDIIEVEKTWTPKSKSTPVEINKNIQEKDEGKSNMTIEELNTKIEKLDKKIIELNSTIEEKNAKITETQDALVDSQKSVTELNNKLKEKETELNSANQKVAEFETKEKEAKEKAEAEAKQTEINNYIEGLSELALEEAEINSVKELTTIEEMKTKVSEICVARVKAQVTAKAQETNTKVDNKKDTEINNIMMSINTEPEKKVIDGEVPLIW